MVTLFGLHSNQHYSGCCVHLVLLECFFAVECQSLSVCSCVRCDHNYVHCDDEHSDRG